VSFQFELLDIKHLGICLYFRWIRVEWLVRFRSVLGFSFIRNLLRSDCSFQKYTRGFFSWFDPDRPEADHSHPSVALVNNSSSLTSVPVIFLHDAGPNRPTWTRDVLYFLLSKWLEETRVCVCVAKYHLYEVVPKVFRTLKPSVLFWMRKKCRNLFGFVWCLLYLFQVFWGNGNLINTWAPRLWRVVVRV
jgi:hypothetical protein